MEAASSGGDGESRHVAGDGWILNVRTGKLVAGAILGRRWLQLV
jgi:hypothetical protein